MAAVEPQRVSKRFGEAVAVDALSLAIAEGRRNMSMIFQSYALWPHMTVHDNVAHGSMSVASPPTLSLPLKGGGDEAAAPRKLPPPLRGRVGVGGLLLAALLLSAPAARAETVNISVPVFNATFGYLFVAQDKGYFAEEGIEPKIAGLSGGVSTPALIGGSLDYSSSPASAISAILRGAALKIVFVAQAHSTEKLWSFDPAVRTLDDLKGKIIAISSRGGTEELAIRMLLAARGLPADFLGFTAMGVGAARVAALRSGQQRYATFGAVEEAELRQAGALANAHVLVDMTKEVELANGGIATSDAELSAHRERTLRLLRAIWKGVRYIEAYQESAVALLAKRFPDAARDSLARDVAQAAAAQNKEGAIAPEAARRELSVRAELLGLPASAVPPLAKVYDFSLIAEARRALEDWHPAR